MMGGMMGNNFMGGPGGMMGRPPHMQQQQQQQQQQQPVTPSTPHHPSFQQPTLPNMPHHSHLQQQQQQQQHSVPPSIPQHPSSHQPQLAAGGGKPDLGAGAGAGNREPNLDAGAGQPNLAADAGAGSGDDGGGLGDKNGRSLQGTNLRSRIEGRSCAVIRSSSPHSSNQDGSSNRSTSFGGSNSSNGDPHVGGGLPGGLLPAGSFQVVGDVHFAEVSQVASALSPVPGGLGPMTIAALLHNTVRAARFTAVAARSVEARNAEAHARKLKTEAESFD